LQKKDLERDELTKGYPTESDVSRCNADNAWNPHLQIPGSYKLKVDKIYKEVYAAIHKVDIDVMVLFLS
jgi:hypothetical protein